MSFRSRHHSLFGVAALVVFAGAAPFSAVRAEDFAKDVPDRVWVDVGGQANQISTQAAVGTASGIGVTVNFEDIFDLPGRQFTARMLGTARISPKRRYIDFGYVDIDRSGSRVLQDDVEFAGYTFLAGGSVKARLATQLIYTAFRYDFLHQESVRISGSAGLTFMRLKTSLAGEGGFVEDPNGVPITSDFRKVASTGAPVPMVGLNLDWALTRRLVVRTYYRFFRLNASGLNGGMYENGVRLNWYLARYFGLGVGFDRTDLKLKELELDNGNKLKFDYAITGVGLYANIAF